MSGGFDFAETAKMLHALGSQLPMFVVTDHPSDEPEYFVARLYLTLPQNTPTNFTLKHPELEPLQDVLEALGLTKLMRDPADDPVIVEVWL
jgi:hypothetical protein